MRIDSIKVTRAVLEDHLDSDINKRLRSIIGKLLFNMTDNGVYTVSINLDEGGVSTQMAMEKGAENAEIAL
jgi:hypothetical protein